MPSKFPFHFNPNRFASSNSNLKSSLRILASRLFPFPYQIPPINGDPVTPKSTPIAIRQFSVNPTGPSPNPDSSASIDAGYSIRKQMVSLWPGTYHSLVTNALWEARSNFFEEDKDAGNGGDEGELLSKTPDRSRTTVDYKFSKDFVLREQYGNPWNEIRMGKLVEDLDALAGTIWRRRQNDEGNKDLEMEWVDFEVIG